MPSFRVSFYNRLTNSYGRPFDVCQRRIDVTAPDGRDRAVDLAKREFERIERVSDWRNRARHLECEEVQCP